MGYEETADQCRSEQDGYPIYCKEADKVTLSRILTECLSMRDNRRIIPSNGLKHLLNKLPLMICVLQETRLIYYNSTFKSVLGYDDKTFSTINFLDLVHPRFKRLVQDQLIIVKANLSSSFHNRIKIISRTGKELWVDILIQPLDFQGNKYIEVTADKIDQYMHSIDEIRLRHDRLYSIIEDMTELVEIEDQNYKITFANNAYCRYFGKTREELLQTIGLDLIYEEDRQSIMDAVCSMTPYHPTVYAESRVIKANGEIGWISWTAHGFFAKSGKLMSHQAVGRDITELKKYEEELLLSEARYRGIVEDQSEFIQRIMPDLTTIFVNDAYCRFFCCQKEDLVGKKCTQHVYNEDHALVEVTIKKLSPKNDFVIFAERVLTQKGQFYWIEWTARGFFNRSGELKEIQLVGRDITDRKIAQRALQKAHDELELRVKERTFELSKVNTELSMLNSNMQSLISNMDDGVMIVDMEGHLQDLNPILQKTCGKAYPEILERIKSDILGEKHKYIINMLRNKRAFKDVEVAFSIPKEEYHFLVSGTPLENVKDAVNCGFLIISPMKEVHNLVNRFSGARARFNFEDIVTEDLIMQETIYIARQAATSNGNVLITGESGTGKEMFAQAIHNASQRCRGPFVAVNCGAIPRDLIGSELFGYVEGAFTGAKKGGNPGKFELASGGTIFLDEIGDMPFEQQIALLRVIQERSISRIGSNKEIPINVRIICATNKNLLIEVDKGNFRKDLYYRLNVINIRIPPLRERSKDVKVLFNYFIKKLQKSDPICIDKEIIKYLTMYSWPGNVRELQNIVERMLYTANGEHLTTDCLPREIHTFVSDTSSILLQPEEKHEEITINQVREQKKKRKVEEERREILMLLERYNGNVSRVAREMGISRSTLYKKMNKYRIST